MTALYKNLDDINQMEAFATETCNRARSILRKYKTNDQQNNTYTSIDADDERQLLADLHKLVNNYSQMITRSIAADDINATVDIVAIGQHKFDKFLQIWLQIREIFNVLIYSSVWTTEKGCDEKSMHSVINDQLVRDLNTTTDTWLQNVIKHTADILKGFVGQNIYTTDDEFDQMNPNKIAIDLTKLLNLIPSFCNRINASALSVWRCEQKRAMLGIGMRRSDCGDELDQMIYETVEFNGAIAAQKRQPSPSASKRKSRRATPVDDVDLTICTFCRPSRTLTAAKKYYQSLMHHYNAIHDIINNYCTIFGVEKDQSEYFFNQLCIHLRYLLQSSFVIDWSHKGLCQPSPVIRSKTKDHLNLIIKILALNNESTVDYLNMALNTAPNQRVAVNSIDVQLMNPTKGSASEIAIPDNFAHQLVTNSGEMFMDPFIANAANNRHRASVIYPAEDATLNAKDYASKRAVDSVGFTKLVVQFNSDNEPIVDDIDDIPTMTYTFQDITLSSPFLISVGKAQDMKEYESFIWGLLASEKDSLTCYVQPTADSSIFWGDYRDALRWLIYKKTNSNHAESRELDNAELSHIANRLFNQLSGSQVPITVPASHYFKYQHIQQNPFDRRGQFTFFKWYYEFVELIMDRNEKFIKVNANIQERLTMVDLFRRRIVYGFISREEAEQLLNTSAHNAMIMRFSDHYPGNITISYKIKDGNAKVEHIRPWCKQILEGMGLPSIVAGLVNLRNVQHIIVGARIEEDGTPIFVPKFELTGGVEYRSPADKGETDFPPYNDIELKAAEYPKSRHRKTTPSTTEESGSVDDSITDRDDEDELVEKFQQLRNVDRQASERLLKKINKLIGKNGNSHQPQPSPIVQNLHQMDIRSDISSPITPAMMMVMTPSPRPGEIQQQPPFIMMSTNQQPMAPNFMSYPQQQPISWPSFQNQNTYPQQPQQSASSFMQQQPNQQIVPNQQQHQQYFQHQPNQQIAPNQQQQQQYFQQQQANIPNASYPYYQQQQQPLAVQPSCYHHQHHQPTSANANVPSQIPYCQMCMQQQQQQYVPQQASTMLGNTSYTDPMLVHNHQQQYPFGQPYQQPPYNQQQPPAVHFPPPTINNPAMPSSLTELTPPQSAASAVGAVEVVNSSTDGAMQRYPN